MDDRGDARRLSRLHLWQIQGVRDVLLVVVAITLFWLGYALRYVTVPLLIAFGLAYLVEPVVAWTCRKSGWGRPWVVSILLCVSALGVLGAGALLVPTIVSQGSRLVQQARGGGFTELLDRVEGMVPPAYREDLRQARSWLGENFLTPMKEAKDSIRAAATSAQSPGDDPAAPEPVEPEPAAATAPAPAVHAESPTVSPAIESILGKGVVAAWETIRGLAELAFAAALVPFYFWFFSVGYPKALGFLQELVPISARPEVFRLAGEMDRAVSGFVRVRIMVALLMAVLFALGWWFCGVPFAITLGLVAGILSIVPYLGLVVLPLVVLLGISAQLGLPEAERMSWWWMIGGPVLVFGLVQALEGNLLTPLLAGATTNLGPVTVFVAILAGASLAGVYGMLLAIPAAACIKIVIREVVLPDIREWVQGKRSDPLPLE